MGDNILKIPDTFPISNGAREKLEEIAEPVPNLSGDIASLLRSS